MKLKYTIFLVLVLLSLNVKSQSQVIKPIPVDKEVLSGLNLKAVKNKDQPDRRLFQKNIFWGKEIGVFIVSSETASARQENYAMEEFLYLLNGRSRMNPDNGDEIIFKTGDYFVAPKGFTGEWETQGGGEFILELSVIARNRPEVEVNPDLTLPVALDRNLLSGYDMPSIENGKSAKKVLYAGLELTVEVEIHKNGIQSVEESKKEQLLQVLSGKLTITDAEGEVHTFYRGEWFILPQGFEGQWEMQAHGLFRTLRITRSDLM